MTEWVLREATQDDLDVCIVLEGLASAAANAFAYDSPAEAGRIRRWFLERGATELQPPWAFLASHAGAPVGLLAVLPASAVVRQRLRAAMLLRRAGPEVIPAAVARRLELVGGTLVRCARDDAYLARIAVMPGQAGRGLGSWLLDRAMEQVAEMGAHRLVLDVADDNAHAIGFYRRRGFVEIGHEAIVDASTGRRVGHLHLALPVGGTPGECAPLLTQ